MATKKQLDWFCSDFAGLNTQQLYQLLQLRAEVFVVEQNCSYQDLDGKDQHCWHLLGADAVTGELVAYSRILAPGEVFSCVAIGRVVIRQSRRSMGLGQQLMQKAIQFSQHTWPDVEIALSAQCQCEGFYQSLGFVSEGSPYLEDGIPHQHMRLMARQ